MENEELIRRDMERTRESLTDKLETLENKVVSSVEQATSAVTQTVENVKETMHEGVETVKEAVDIKAHVDRHPWLMLGGAMLAGYAIGTMLGGANKQLGQEKTAPRRPMVPSRSQGNGHHKGETERHQPAGPSWFTLLEPEIQKLQGLALGVALGTLREAVTAEIPPHLAEMVGQIIDSVTEKVGGNPLPGTDLPFTSSERSAGESQQAFDSDKPRW